MINNKACSLIRELYKTLDLGECKLTDSEILKGFMPLAVKATNKDYIVTNKYDLLCTDRDLLLQLSAYSLFYVVDSIVEHDGNNAGVDYSVAVCITVNENADVIVFVRYDYGIGSKDNSIFIPVKIITGYEEGSKIDIALLMDHKIKQEVK